MVVRAHMIVKILEHMISLLLRPCEPVVRHVIGVLEGTIYWVCWVGVVILSELFRESIDSRNGTLSPETKSMSLMKL
jgi:hypothetical protein